MARTYKRDAKGRFTGGGGSSGGGKKKGKAPKAKPPLKGPGFVSLMNADAAGGRHSTKKANAAEFQRLTDKGITGVGSRLAGKTAAKFTGAKKTKAAAASMVRGRNISSRARVKSTIDR